MKEKKTKIMGLRLLLFVTLGFLLLPSVSGQDPPLEEKDCLFYAYSEAGNHYFLIQNNSVVFGEIIQIKHNCQYLEVFSNGQFLAGSPNSFNVQIEIGLNNMSFEYDNRTENYTFEVIPDRLNWEFEYEDLQSQRVEFISIDTANTQEVYASIFSIIIVWVLCVYVYWRLIESYVNKNFIEEVVN
jgi:hypothetical protein